MASGNIHGDTNKTIADKLMNLDISDCGKVRSLYLFKSKTSANPRTSEYMDRTLKLPNT